MHGLMMDRPLLISSLLEHAAFVFGTHVSLRQANYQCEDEGDK